MLKTSESPCIHIFFLSQGSRERGEMPTKSENVCMCVALISLRSKLTFGSNLVGLLLYGGWGLELNFLGFQIEENIW